MSLKRFSMLVPVLLVASFGLVASCGEKEKSPGDALEEAADEAGEAAEEAGDALEEATDK